MSKKIVKKCKDCDNEFQSYISKGRIFCSKACATGFRLRGKEKKEETKIKMSEFALIRFSDKTKHPRWKGDGVGYRTLHKWVENEIGRPKICSKCEKEGYGHSMHWANISGKYLRDITDWVRLCVSCHKYFDKQKKLCIK